MIDSATLITYVAIVVGFVFVPGPATLLTIARSATSGTKAGVATAFGIAVGDIIHTAMAVIGLSALIYTSAFMFSLVKYLGAAYLIYLGIQALLATSPDTTEQSQMLVTPRTAFRQAILAEVLNPKTALFFLAFLPQFVKPENGAVALQLSVLGILLVTIGLFSTLVFAVCAGRVSRFLRQNPAVMRWQTRVVGTLYCCLGVRLAMQER